MKNFLIFEANPGLIVGLVLGGIFLLALIIIIANVKIIGQTEKGIVERLGSYRTTYGTGIHVMLPFFDRLAHRIDMREQVRDFEPQSVITADNVTMKIDTVVFYCVTDPKLFAYGVENPAKAIEFLSATTLRNIIGELDLDATLTSRDIINEKMRKIKRALTLAIIFVLMTGTAGCARLQSGVHDLHGSIIGNEYNIDVFDNTGIRTLKSHGKKIDIDNNIVEERTYASATDEWYTTKTLSSVITITIDGRQLISCGDTCVFYDKRLIPEYEFYLDNIESDSSGILDSTLISGRVNSIKNEFGKPMVVIIKSQMGAPIYAFSGDKVFWDIEEDLPRFTKLMIDGKALYIHRANFQIIDKSLLD